MNESPLITSEQLRQRAEEARVLCQEKEPFPRSIVACGDGLKVYGDPQADPVAVLSSGAYDEALAYYHAIDGEKRVWHPAFLPRGFNQFSDEKRFRVFAVGSSVTECLHGFADSLGATSDHLTIQFVDNELDRPYIWTARFTIDGTSFKASGLHVPGGVLMTEWS